MNQERLTPDLKRSLEIAVDSARARHNIFVDMEHLLLSSLSNDFVKGAIENTQFNAENLAQAVTNELSIIREKPLKLQEIKGLTQDAQHAIERAAGIARTMGLQSVNSGHLLLSILMEPSPFLEDIINRQPHLNKTAIQVAVQQFSSNPPKNFKESGTSSKWKYDRFFGGSTKSQQPRVQFTEVPAQRSKQPQENFSTQNQIMIGLGIIAAVIYGAFVAPTATIAVVIIMGGWIVSLVLHEFSHALVAYWGGDHGVVERGYLTLNPFKYTHPFLSIVLPLFFLAIGGIGLPGGAVYIDHSRLKNKYWSSLVSAAGPMATGICLIVFSAPFWSGYVTLDRYFEAQTQWGSLAFLVFLQAIAILLNLIPLPPLDGFGIIEPFLPDDISRQLRSLGSIGFLLIILMLWIPDTGSGFNPGTQLFTEAENITYNIGGVTPGMPADGYEAFRFWD